MKKSKIFGFFVWAGKWLKTIQNNVFDIYWAFLDAIFDIFGKILDGDEGWWEAKLMVKNDDFW